jgi:hypothetical protein
MTSATAMKDGGQWPSFSLFFPGLALFFPGLADFTF